MQTKNSEQACPPQSRAFTCAACGVKHSFSEFGAGLTNEMMEVGEYAPICKACTVLAQASDSSRQRIELEIRRQCREGVPGSMERVVILAPEVFARG